MAIPNGYFGAGTGSINMDDVECTGKESSLMECSFNENNDCTHKEDAGVMCGTVSGTLQRI